MTSDGQAIEPTTAEDIKDRVTRAFLEVKEQFPFPGYMDHKLYKCIAVSSALSSNDCRPGSTILSIGSGPCDCEGVLSKLGYNVNALDDLSDHWHLIGKNRERILAFAKKMGIEFTMQSLYEYEFRVDHFDAVLLLDVLEHLHRSPRELLNQAVSSLKPGGILVIETPNAVMLANRLKVLFGKSSQAALDLIFWNIGEYRSHVREYSEYELKKMLSYEGLESIDSRLQNCAIRDFEAKGPMKKVAVFIYGIATWVYPRFRDTIMVVGKKPKDWEPVRDSVERFGEVYRHVRDYDLDS